MSIYFCQKEIKVFDEKIPGFFSMWDWDSNDHFSANCKLFKGL